MTDTTTFYRLDSGGIARWTRTATTSELAQYHFGLRKWVVAPDLLGKIVGIGGDGHATVISRDEAQALLDSRPRDPD